jgi:hypothetical protein
LRVGVEFHHHLRHVELRDFNHHYKIIHGMTLNLFDLSKLTGCTRLVSTSCQFIHDWSTLTSVITSLTRELTNKWDVKDMKFNQIFHLYFIMVRVRFI